MTFPSKKELKRRYEKSKRTAGISVSDAKDAYGLGVIGKREYDRVKKKHAKHALN